MRQMGTERQYRAAQPGLAVDPGAAEEHPALRLDSTKQRVVERVDIDSGRAVAEGDDRKIGRWPGIPARHLRQARMEIARELDLLRLRRAECGDSGELERKPQPERSEMAGELGRQGGGGKGGLAPPPKTGLTRACAAR